MEAQNGGAYRCVVGIDVAKQAHMVCAVCAPSGQVQLPPTRIPASREGHAQLLTWLGAWAAELAGILVGLESTGALREPLYEALTRAGYTVLVLNPRQTVSWITCRVRWKLATPIDCLFTAVTLSAW